MPKLTLIFCVVVQSVLSTPISDNLVIELPDGQVQGTTYITKTNKTYFGFQGIPYAAPPIGNLRFEAPQPPKPWDQIWDATKDGKACMSTYHWTYLDNENEDCLYVNVYTPEIKPATKLPVMFWIYGGGFVQGSSVKWLYGPDFLIDEDVIVVSFNYRIGPFGFLSTGDTAIRGNAGLKDQNLALKWAHDNIAHFGGDPEKITIFGQSAGGASSGLHLLSKKSAGLFRAAIVESGSALTSWAIDLDPKSYALLLVDALSGANYENDTQKLKEFLQEKSAEEIVNATITLLNTNQQNWPVLEVDDEDAFLSESPYELIESGRFNQVPILTGIAAEESLMFLASLFRAAIVESGSALIPWAIDPNPKSTALLLVDALSGENYENDTQKLKQFLQEKSAEEIINATIILSNNNGLNWPVLEVDDEDAFLSESPYELIKSGKFNQVPILTGICAEESLMFLANLEQAKQIAESYDSIPSNLIPTDLRQNFSDNDAIIKAIQNIYLSEGQTFSSNLVALADFYTDNAFTRGVIKQAQLSSNYVPVYLYQFAYYGRPMTQAFIDGAEKASHSAEIPFLFNMTGLSDTTDTADLKTQSRTTYLWANFAKFLNPTPEPSELLNNIIWPTISPTDLKFLNINDTVELRSNLRSNSYPEWNRIFETYGKKPFITY